MDHELHRRVVVVEQQHTIQLRPLGLRLGLGDDRRSGTALAFALAIVVRQAGWWHSDYNFNRQHWFVPLSDLRCARPRDHGSAFAGTP